MRVKLHRSLFLRVQTVIAFTSTTKFSPTTCSHTHSRFNGCDDFLCFLWYSYTATESSDTKPQMYTHASERERTHTHTHTHTHTRSSIISSICFSPFLFFPSSCFSRNGSINSSLSSHTHWAILITPIPGNPAHRQSRWIPQTQSNWHEAPKDTLHINTHIHTHTYIHPPTPPCPTPSPKGKKNWGWGKQQTWQTTKYLPHKNGLR